MHAHKSFRGTEPLFIDCLVNVQFFILCNCHDSEQSVRRPSPRFSHMCCAHRHGCFPGISIFMPASRPVLTRRKKGGETLHRFPPRRLGKGNVWGCHWRNTGLSRRGPSRTSFFQFSRNLQLIRTD